MSLKPNSPQVLARVPFAANPPHTFVVRSRRSLRMPAPLLLLASWLIAMPFFASVLLGFVNLGVLVVATAWWSRRSRALRRERAPTSPG